MFKQIYKKFVSIIYSNNIAGIDKKIYLMFHSIEGEMSESNSIYHMSETRFRSICKLLSEIRVQAQYEFGNSVDFIFTFDDGYHNYIENALPVLSKYSFDSIVFLIAKNIHDKSGNYINVNDLNLIKKNKGVTIGLHGYSHVDLSSLSEKSIKSELKNLKDACEELSFHTRYFSLPFGRANDNVIKKLVENGFTEIFTSDYGLKVSIKNGISVYPRIDIWSDDTNKVIKQKIMNYWKLFFIIESFRSKLYRIK